MPFSLAIQQLCSRPLVEGVSYALVFTAPTPRQATVRRQGAELLIQADGAWISLGRIYPAQD